MGRWDFSAGRTAPERVKSEESSDTSKPVALSNFFQVVPGSLKVTTEHIWNVLYLMRYKLPQGLGDDWLNAAKDELKRLDEMEKKQKYLESDTFIVQKE